MYSDLESWYRDRKISVYRPTNDDWAGNFKGEYVCLSFYWRPLPNDEETSLVNIWGNDDFGLERYFDTFREGLNMFNRLQKFFTLDQDTLERLGFEFF